jgi:hypothetical protein
MNVSRSQKPRHKKRTPIYVNKQACLIAIERARVERSPVAEAFASEFEMAALTSLDAVTRGHGTKSQWDTLANCLNHGWLLAKGGIGFEAQPAFASAQEAMRRMIPEFDRSGRVVFASTADRVIVEHALANWSQQIRMATVGEIHDATMVVEKLYWREPERRAA